MIEPHPHGATLLLRAQPGARKNAVLGRHGDALKVAVTAPPEDGRANIAILELLHNWLALKRSQVELLSGATNRNKRVLIHDISPEELAERVASKLGS